MKKICNQLLMQVKLEVLITNYPNTEYALDAEFKLVLSMIFLHQKKCMLEDIILIKKMD